MKTYASSLLLLLAAFLWGCAFVAQKAAVPVFLLLTARSFIGGIFLLCIIPLFDRLFHTGRKLFCARGLGFTKDEVVGGIACGIVLMAASLFQQLGISGIDDVLLSLGMDPVGGTDAGKAAFITALYVVFVPVFCLFFFRKKPALNVWIAVAGAVVGFYLLCLSGKLTLSITDALVLICSLLYTCHVLVIDHFSPKVDGVRMSCIQFLVVGVISAVCFVLFQWDMGFSSLRTDWFPLIYLGICSSGIAYTAQILGQRHTPPATATLLLSLESVFGALSGAVLAGEMMHAREWIGCAIIFLSILTVQLDLPSLLSRLKNRKKESQ